MRTTFLDTSVISECHRRGITAKDFNIILTKNNLLPVVGMYTTYEVARNILTNNPTKGSDLFAFIRKLQPEFSCLRDQLYLMEAQKLLQGTPVEYLLNAQKKDILYKRIDDYCNGKFDQKQKDFIQIRQATLTTYRQAWKPTKNRQKYAQYKHDFNTFSTDFFSNLTTEQAKINWIRTLILFSSENKIALRNRDILNLVKNMKAYPAFRSLIYTHMYLEFLTETNGDTPSEDRFTDALMMIEASYCTTILSNDGPLVLSHAKCINSEIVPISFNELLMKAKKGGKH